MSFLWEWKIFNKKIYFKNLTKRKNNILFKTEHLMHLTKKGGKKSILIFLCV
jgi:hypothetical protein